MEPLVTDRLAPGADVEVVRLEAFTVGAGRSPREPHRHDYHELLWVRSGDGEHRLDGRAVAVVAGAVTLIGRGQVHVFERARSLSGAVVRFSDAALAGGRAATGFLLAGRDERVVAVPPGERERLEAVIDAGGAEARRARWPTAWASRTRDPSPGRSSATRAPHPSPTAPGSEAGSRYPLGVLLHLAT